MYIYTYIYNKKNFVALFYGWGSTVLRPQPLQEAVYFLPLSYQKFLVLILSTSEGWKPTLEPPSGLRTGPLDMCDMFILYI